MKHSVILSIGSNHKAEINVQRTHEMLGKVMTDTRFTGIIETEDADGSGGKFLNQMAAGETEMPFPAFRAYTKKIETILGRTRKRKEYGIIDIDVDILMFDGKTMKPYEWEQPYVKQLIKELQ